MGEGLKRIAEAHGGMRVSARGVTVDYVANNENSSLTIRQRKHKGWEYLGMTEDGKFLQFQMATVKVEALEGKL